MEFELAIDESLLQISACDIETVQDNWRFPKEVVCYYYQCVFIIKIILLNLLKTVSQLHGKQLRERINIALHCISSHLVPNINFDKNCLNLF